MKNPNDLLAQCRYPDVAEPYLTALKEGVHFIAQEFEVIGIIAAGSIIRGAAHATSDWDIYVIHDKPQRQMIQRFFAGVPTQFFVNPPIMVRRYFVSEAAEGTCITANMFTTGFVVLDRDPLVEAMRQEARLVLERGPQVSEDQLTMRAYHIGDQFENALDVIENDPDAGIMILSHAMLRMLQFYFVRQKIFIPRDKDLLRRVREHNPKLGQMVDNFYQTHEWIEKVNFAREIADATIQVQGFFECQTLLETVEKANE
jgi:predicted nucleotidyltransferase